MRKTVSLFISVVLILSLTSCIGLNDDPIDLGRKLNDIYGDDAHILMLMSSEDVEGFAEETGITSNGVYALLLIQLNGNSDEFGVLIYCENSTQAEKIENDFNSLREPGTDDDYIVERSFNVVFLGREDILEDIKSIRFTF